jgi:hypothetical protein
VSSSHIPGGDSHEVCLVVFILTEQRRAVSLRVLGETRGARGGSRRLKGLAPSLRRRLNPASPTEARGYIGTNGRRELNHRTTCTANFLGRRAFGRCVRTTPVSTLLPRPASRAVLLRRGASRTGGHQPRCRTKRSDGNGRCFRYSSRSWRGAPSKNRTCDLGFRKALLYPTELRGRDLRGGGCHVRLRCSRCPGGAGVFGAGRLFYSRIVGAERGARGATPTFARHACISAPVRQGRLPTRVAAALAAEKAARAPL